MPGVLHDQRRALNMTQEEFARALGVSSTTMSRWERGTRSITHPKVVQVAVERLQADAHELPRQTALPRKDAASDRHNSLPAELSTFVGRAKQLEDALAAPVPGRRIAPDAPGQTGALTARELEVARLVAQGLSNRHIAEQLVITQRTVGAPAKPIDT